MKNQVYKFIHHKVSSVQTKIDALLPKYDLQEKHIANLKVLTNREVLLERLPKNGIVAELGVNEGKFSQEILSISKPQILHLVDTWDSERYHGGLKSQVELTFESQIMEGKIKIHQGYSTVLESSFHDKYFDWIYIDTDHSYQNTKNELQAYKDKIKPEGFIAGHDYSQGNWSKILRYGVMEAVHEFCIEEGWELIYLTIEMSNNPSFAIKKIHS
ncbi:hypothetical protein GCM10027284_25360 [Cyclobacterium sediminis]